jgi:imidazolonepropionase-like amidohydrolase
MGSDAVYTMFGQNTRELAWIAKAGMSPEQALKTATVNTADLLGMKEDPGSATTGHYADLIAVEGDPLLDFQVVIDKVRGVMKGGAVVVQNYCAFFFRNCRRCRTSSTTAGDLGLVALL